MTLENIIRTRLCSVSGNLIALTEELFATLQNAGCCLCTFCWLGNTHKVSQHDCGRACQLELMLGSSAFSHLFLTHRLQPAEQSTELNTELNSPQQIMH